MQDHDVAIPTIEGKSGPVLSERELLHRRGSFQEERLREYAPATQETYRRCLNEFARWVAERGGYCPMTPASMEAYRDYLEVERALSASTVSAYINALRQFCKYLAETGFLPVDPAAKLKARAAQAQTVMQPLTDDEILALLAVVPAATTIGKRDIALIYAMVYGGLNLVEVERANIEDLEQTLLGWQLRVSRHGRKKYDALPLDEPVVRRMLEYLETRPVRGPSDPLFLSHSRRSSGGRLDPRSTRRRLNNYLQQAGIDRQGVSPKSLTLTAVLLWHRDELSEEDLKARMRGRKSNPMIRRLKESGALENA